MQPTPVKKKRTGLWITLGILGVVLLGCLIGGIAVISSAAKDVTSSNGGSKPGGATVGMNQAARDGKFEFTVTKLECGKPELGSGLLTKKAQGQFCVATVTVKNIGNEARTFSSGSQFAFGAGGVKYTADSAATIYLDEANSFLVDINPGNSVSGLVAFDISKDAQIQKLELHDSTFSGGVTVNVSS